MLLHWSRILSFISTLLLWMGFSQALRGGGSELSTDKEPHSQTTSSPAGDFPSTPEETALWQQKLGCQTNSRSPLQRLFPHNSVSALPGTALPLTWTCRLLLWSSETLGRSYHEPSASTTPAKVLLFIEKALLPSKKLSLMKLKESEPTSPVVRGLYQRGCWQLKQELLDCAWNIGISHPRGWGGFGSKEQLVGALGPIAMPL